MTPIRRFARFLYDFLVGDAWELFIGPILSLIVVAVLVGRGIPAAAAGVILVLLVIGVAALHLVLALRGAA